MQESTPRIDRNAYNNVNIQQIAARLVAPAFQQIDLLDYVKCFVFDDEHGVESLYAAINTDYHIMKAEYDKMSPVERANSALAIEIDLVHQYAMFFIGLAVGQRLKIGPG